MTKDTLASRIVAAHQRLQQLTEAQKRMDAGQRCSLLGHETVCVQVWTGAGRSLAPALQNGFQIHECLACDRWVLATYEGRRVKDISETSAKRILRDGFVTPSKLDE